MRCGKIHTVPFNRKRIEVVITGLTRNQVAFTGSWVRIPPLPPKRRVKLLWFYPAFSFGGCSGIRRGNGAERPSGGRSRPWKTERAVRARRNPTASAKTPDKALAVLSGVFFWRVQWDSKGKRRRATFRWTVATVEDRARSPREKESHRFRQNAG